MANPGSAAHHAVSRAYKQLTDIDPAADPALNDLRSMNVLVGRVFSPPPSRSGSRTAFASVPLRVRAMWASIYDARDGYTAEQWRDRLIAVNYPFGQWWSDRLYFDGIQQRDHRNTEQMLSELATSDQAQSPKS